MNNWLTDLQQCSARRLLTCTIASLMGHGCATTQFESDALMDCRNLKSQLPNTGGSAGSANDAPRKLSRENGIHFLSSETERSLVVLGVDTARTPTQMLLVEARFVSCLDVAATVLVRTSFSRGEATVAGPPSAWKSVYLSPRATAYYSEFSTAPDATGYLIEVTR